MENFVFLAGSEQETAALGRRLAELLPAGAVVALTGPLGAGKTRLVRAVAEASGVDPRAISSPTFVLVHEYQGRRPIFHFDAYRVKDEDEFQALAPDEYFDAGGLSFVEWADRVRGCLPRDCLWIAIEPTGSESRRVTVTAGDDRWQPVIANLAAWQSERRCSSDQGRG